MGKRAYMLGQVGRARSSGPKQKETSISGSRLYYGVHLHNATNNTREVEGGPKTLTRACYRALFDVVDRIRSIDHHACDPRIQNCRRVR